MRRRFRGSAAGIFEGVGCLMFAVWGQMLVFGVVGVSGTDGQLCMAR